MWRGDATDGHVDLSCGTLIRTRRGMGRDEVYIYSLRMAMRLLWHENQGDGVHRDIIITVYRGVSRVTDESDLIRFRDKGSFFKHLHCWVHFLITQINPYFNKTMQFWFIRSIERGTKWFDQTFNRSSIDRPITR
jgi:hypothetical protein